MKGRRKSAFKEFLPLATKDSHFYSDIILSKQVGGLVVGSPLCPILANSFLVCHEKNVLKFLHSKIDHFTIEGMLVVYNWGYQKILEPKSCTRKIDKIHRNLKLYQVFLLSFLC